MPVDHVGVQILPPDDGAKPWLPSEPVMVPVVVGQDKVGVARVYAGDDGSLMADITFADHEMVKIEGVIHYSAHGKVEEADERQRAKRVRTTSLEAVGVEDAE